MRARSKPAVSKLNPVVLTVAILLTELPIAVAGIICKVLYPPEISVLLNVVVPTIFNTVVGLVVSKTTGSPAQRTGRGRG